MANCLACGIFLSTCFLGLLPHVRHQEMVLRGMNGTGSSKESSQSQSFLSPMISTEVIVLLGFLLILLIEQVSSDSAETLNRTCVDVCIETYVYVRVSVKHASLLQTHTCKYLYVLARFCRVMFA